MESKISKIRNFAIIAHIDHGKSTLADRMFEITKVVNNRTMKKRILDTLELEQERGITIKMQTARMNFEYSGTNKDFISNESYILNLVDTPGHVDFSYEASRSLAASEGAIVLVDATQGIQAQTFSNIYKALDLNLPIIPVINKIDLPGASINEVIKSMVANFDFKENEIILTSAKTGKGVVDLLNEVVEKIPAPNKSSSIEPKALVYDSFYDEHMGVIALIKVIEGNFEDNESLFLLNSETKIEPVEIGYLTPALNKQANVFVGEIGYIATGLKDIKKVHAGDTIVRKSNFLHAKRLPGYILPKPMVYASLFPVDSDEFEQFNEALDKLALNDPALTYQKEHSQALGTGFSCGFLGLLHLEITTERLEREFGINLIATSPGVEYKISLTTKDYSKVKNLNIANIDVNNFLVVKSASEFPDSSLINKIYEPWVNVEILTPEDYLGSIMELANERRGEYIGMEYLSGNHNQFKSHVILKYNFPTAEIIIDFFDKLKSISRGYASFDYSFKEYKEADIVKVSILINYEKVEALSFLTHSSLARKKGKTVTEKLSELIPKQQFKVPIQASIGSQVIARETIQAYRKDVTAKLYGGDVTRKMKLLEKQKKGKKRLKTFGKVEIPKEVFINALKN